MNNTMSQIGTQGYIKPRVRMLKPVFKRHTTKYTDTKGSQYTTYYQMVTCTGAGISAKGHTITGAYKNWLSLYIAQCRINEVLS